MKSFALSELHIPKEQTEKSQEINYLAEMKKCRLFYFVILIVLFANNSIFAQTDSLKRTKFEVGIGVASVPLLFNDKHLPSPSIVFKIVRNKNAFRSGIYGWYKGRQTSAMNDLNYSASALLNAGYERRFFNKKSQLLTGFDVVYKYQQTSGNPPLQVESKIMVHSYGGGPLIGYIFQPTKRLSFQTELAFVFVNRHISYTPAIKPSYKVIGDWELDRSFSLHAYYRF